MEELDWVDNEITEVLNKKWKIWLIPMKEIFNAKILRNKSTIQIPTYFCDASKKSYLSTKDGNDIETSFENAKTNVQALLTTRFESHAALLRAELENRLKGILNLSISQTFYWSDSKTVLY